MDKPNNQGIITIERGSDQFLIVSYSCDEKTLDKFSLHSRRRVLTRYDGGLELAGQIGECVRDLEGKQYFTSAILREVSRRFDKEKPIKNRNGSGFLGRFGKSIWERVLDRMYA